jgi:hypothetical protein
MRPDGTRMARDHDQRRPSFIASDNTHPVRGMYLKMGDSINGLERETQSLLEWRLGGEAEEVTCSKMDDEDTRCAISNLNRRQRATFIRPEGSST